MKKTASSQPPAKKAAATPAKKTGTTPAKKAGATTRRTASQPRTAASAPPQPTVIREEEQPTAVREEPETPAAAELPGAEPQPPSGPAASTDASDAAPAQPAVATTDGGGDAPHPPAAAPDASAVTVDDDEFTWTEQELDDIRAELEAEIVRLRREIEITESELAERMRDGGDGAGDDQADAGTKTFEREHEMSLANNARDLLVQTEHALARIADGTYGRCENCGKPINKLRLQANPRATLCVSCKQREERR
ncbi:MAG: TraR/DksA C4-type zinc finger protein [Acidothermus sp.]|nr:TraR/DksA C4-type zinc finger protein [Acidothermus sp.]